MDITLDNDINKPKENNHFENNHHHHYENNYCQSLSHSNNSMNYPIPPPIESQKKNGKYHRKH